MRVGGKGRVRGLGEECAAGCVGQGRHARPGARARGQWRVRPALIAVGGRAMRLWRGKRERERGTVGEKEKVTSTNGIGSWEWGIRNREKIFSGFRVRVFRRFLSSTTKKSFEKFACDLFGEFFGSLQTYPT